MADHVLANGMLGRVAELAADASGGTVTADVAASGGGSLLEAGLTSLGYLRLIDAIETEYGIYVDLEEASGKLGTVEQIVDYIHSQGVVDA
ncbi:MAG: acyl carrier protein [Kibdelosporangium sp.]